MSLEFFRKKRFPRRHSDVFCQRMALTIPCIISLSNPLALPVVKGPNVYADAARLPDLLQIQSPQGCRTILLPQGSSALCTIDLPAFAECPEASQLLLLHFASATVADSFSTAHVKTSLAPGCTLTTKFSVRRAQDTNSLSVFFNGGGFPKPFVSTQVGLVRAGFAAANTADPQCLRKRLWQI